VSDPIGISHLSSQIGLREPHFDSDGRTLVWLERRGAQACLVCRVRGEIADRDLDTARAVKARVFYGGGDFTVAGGVVYYVGDGDRLCSQPLAGGPGRDLTPAHGHPAAPAASRDGHWLVYVHTDGHTDRLAIVDTQGKLWPQSLTVGADFYMQPTWHPNGRQLAWVEWDSPNMAWDGCRLMLGTMRRPGGTTPILDECRVLAGDDGVAVFQPSFSPDGRWLAYASDESGDSRLWLHSLANDERRCLTPEHPGDVGAPGWVQGLSVLGFSADSRSLHFTAVHDAARQAWTCDIDTGAIEPITALSEYTDISHLACSPKGDEIAVIASSSLIPERVVTIRNHKATIQARSSSEALPADTLVQGEAIRWSTTAGDPVHGLLFPAPGVTDRAPTLVMVHGGPTSQDRLGFDMETQYWASRGWSVLCVNYRGSTGYGRHYMTSLRGQWGVYDVEDAVTGARHLVDTGSADPDRLVVMGGSAGGFTVLRTLSLHPGLFRAAICRYGVSNLFSLARTTHKFEARYTDLLVGPLPEAAARYRERSPIHHADAIRDAIAIFQGDEDEVVTRDQSDDIVASLKEREIPHQYHVYEGEGHGWRRPETKEAYIRSVESFLEQHVLLA
jgi:dipeptidyl aminopeptidase/acylaminoacyl peptidase